MTKTKTEAGQRLSDYAHGLTRLDKPKTRDKARDIIRKEVTRIEDEAEQQGFDRGVEAGAAAYASDHVDLADIMEVAEALKTRFGYLMFGSQRVYDKQAWIDHAQAISNFINEKRRSQCPPHHGRDPIGGGCFAGACPNSTGPDIG